MLFLYFARFLVKQFYSHVASCHQHKLVFVQRSPIFMNLTRALILEKAREDVLKQHEKETARIQVRNEALKKRDPDYYQEWWDTLDADSLVNLFATIRRPGFVKRLAELLRIYDDDEKRLLPKLMRCEPMQLLLRNTLEKTKGLVTLHNRHQHIVHGHQAMLPSKKWWRRPYRPLKREKDHERGITFVLSPKDFFKEAWFDAFSVESKMAGSPLDFLYTGLGKHAFAMVVKQVREHLYGDVDFSPFQLEVLMYEDRLQDELEQRFVTKKRKR